MSPFVKTLLLLTTVLLLTACGLFGPEEPEPTEPVERQVVPTFTPTATVDPSQAAAQVEPTSPAEAPTQQPPQEPEATVSPSEGSTSEGTTSETEAPATESQPAVEDTATPQPEPTNTPSTDPVLIVSGEIINIRSGPSTAHAITGAANQGERFELTGKNQGGDWWEVCCIEGEPGWVFSLLATVENADLVAIAANIPTPPPAPTPLPVAEAPAEEVAAEAVAEAPPEQNTQPGTPPDPAASSEGWFDPNAQYHVTNLRVLGLGENNGGIRSSSSLHYILVTVLDENGNPAEGAVLKNLVGDKLDHPTGSKGAGRTEITMFWEPYKLQVVSDASGPVTSQISNQMGLAFPHLPDIVGKLGDENYEYGRCPTLEIRCEWPIQAVHFSYEITFQKMK